MRLARIIAVALLALAPALALAQGAPAPLRLPRGSTGPADSLTVTRGGITSPLSAALTLGGGATAVSTTGGGVTLSAATLASRVIVVSGALTANAVVTFPAGTAYAGQWSVINAAVGGYTVTARTAGQSASAIDLPVGQPRTVSSDGATLTSSTSQATGLTTPTATTTSNLACWGGTAGQAIADCGYGVGTGGRSLAALDGRNSWSEFQFLNAGSSAHNTIGQRLRRLASQGAASNALDAPVYSGVTMTQITAPDASLTKVYKPNTTPNAFAAYGGTATIYNTDFWLFPVSSLAPSNGNLSGYYPGTPDLNANGWGVEFYTDEPKPTIRISGFASATTLFRVIVDGQYVDKAGRQFAQTGLSYVQLDFGGVRQPRRIQIRSQGGNAYGGVLVGPLSTVWAPDQGDVIRVAFSGDSYTDRMGVAGSTELPDAMWCHVAGTLLGWRDVRQVAVGSTGYLNDAGGQRSTIQAQIPRWIGTNPDVVVFAAGYNDSISSPAALTAAALKAYRTVRAALPTTPIVILGPWAGGGGVTSDLLAKEAAIYSAFQTFVGENGAAPNAFFIPLDAIPSPYLDGTGNVSAPNGTGNADLYISSDAVHPSSAGHLYLGRRVADQIRSAFARAFN